MKGGLPRWLGGKESACNARDVGSIPALEKPFGEGNGYPLQYSCLENSRDRGTWQTTVHGVTESDMTEVTNTHVHLERKRGQDLVPSAGGLSQEGVSVLASPQGVTASDPREREGRGLGLGTRVCEWGP